MKVKAIDVSVYQGSIDWGQVKDSGVEVAILRAGYGRTASQKDSKFDEYYAGAKAVGMKVGAYWYAYADSVEDAKREAAACMEVIKGKKFEYPIYYDVEERSILDRGSDFVNSIIRAWHDALRSNKWYSGLYMSRSPLENLVDDKLAFDYALWVAEWGSSCRYSGDYGMWQYTSKGRVNGINTNVDRDWALKPYPDTIINGGWNGYTKTSTSSKPSLKSVDEIAREVIAGKWGNGNDRKNRLTSSGYDYTKIQNRVNELMGASAKPSLKSVDEIAREVIAGKWGNGNERKNRLTSAGYDYSAVQNRVNELMGATRSSSPKQLYTVKVDIPNLNIRTGPGTNYSKTGKFTGVGVFGIVEEKNGWGKLYSGAGWINLTYTRKV